MNPRKFSDGRGHSDSGVGKIGTVGPVTPPSYLRVSINSFDRRSTSEGHGLAEKKRIMWAQGWSTDSWKP